MYQHPRLRTTYESNTRFNPYQQTTSSDQERPVLRSERSFDGSMASGKQNNNNNDPRKNRYTRASTLSVTQILTDSCSSLLQRLTTKVRGPSQTAEQLLHNNQNQSQTSLQHHRHQHQQQQQQQQKQQQQQPQQQQQQQQFQIQPKMVTHQGTNTSSISSSRVSTSTNTETSLLGSTRSRLEDKYSAVLEKLAGRKKDHERTLEPSNKMTEKRTANPLMKSATSAVLPEKSVPYASTLHREKTPYRSSAHRLSQHHNHYPEPPYAYLDYHSAYYLRHKSNLSDLRPRRSSKPLRKSELGSTRTNTMKLCPVEIPVDDILRDDKTPTNSDFVDPEIAERETKRKEIQNLIMKYSALDEAYNKATSKATVIAPITFQQPPPPPPHSVKIAHKYQPSVSGLTVSNTGVCRLTRYPRQAWEAWLLSALGRTIYNHNAALTTIFVSLNHVFVCLLC